MLPKIPEGFGKAVEATAETAKEFLEKLLGPASEEAGLLLGDKVRFVRFKRQVKILTDARQLLSDAGVEPESVPLKTLAPILESGSLEDDESMSARWSALLATAANPNATIDVLPSFPEILKQLSPLEVLIMDLVFKLVKQTPIPRSEWSSRGAVGPQLRRVVNIGESEFGVAIESLFRLRLCAPPSSTFEFLNHPDRRFQLDTKELICMTEFGFAFVTACSSVQLADSRTPVATASAEAAKVVNGP